MLKKVSRIRTQLRNIELIKAARTYLSFTPSRIRTRSAVLSQTPTRVSRTFRRRHLNRFAAEEFRAVRTNAGNCGNASAATALNHRVTRALTRARQSGANNQARVNESLDKCSAYTHVHGGTFGTNNARTSFECAPRHVIMYRLSKNIACLVGIIIITFIYRDGALAREIVLSLSCPLVDRDSRAVDFILLDS